jgi:ABC-type bacteriocin/lantibiotic exporter with double-glycine peptidase domain
VTAEVAEHFIESRGILFLDEGTSNLDVENEKRINITLQKLKMTR